MPWVLKQQKTVNKRNPYGDVVGTLVQQALAALNEGQVNPVAASTRYKVSVIVVPASATTSPYLRLARIVTDDDPLVQCALALGAPSLSKDSVELTGTAIPLVWDGLTGA